MIYQMRQNLVNTLLKGREGTPCLELAAGHVYNVDKA